MKKMKTTKELPHSESRLASVLRSKEMREALAECAEQRNLAPSRGLAFADDLAAQKLRGGARGMARAVEVVAAPPAFDRMTEAIILKKGRPVLLVKDGLVEKADLPIMEKRLAPVRAALRRPIGSVGRIELAHHDTFDWCGTGWRIEDDLIVTNRHVALVFAERHGSTFPLQVNQAGTAVEAQVDFREEWRGTVSEEIKVAKVLWIAEDSAAAPDMAVLKLEKSKNLPPPLKLAAKAPKAQQQIAVVGYPARDSRNGADAMAGIFKDIYEVKRFAPGEVVVPGDDGTWYLTHDASTLGGNSGSALLDLDTQTVLGLHFGGSFLKTNYAVKASVIQSILKRKSWVSMAPAGKVQPEAFTEKKRTLASMKGRKGYDSGFLGIAVAMPTPGPKHKVLPVKFEGNALPYTHFSIVMSEERRLAIFTAENLDGGKKKKLKRKDSWGFDPRIAAAAQVGHKEFYGPEPFDKGHMVRRENPGWGDTVAEAQLGEDDSFIYTNAVPQMPDLNQKTWLSLEDYVLENAKVEGFKVTVFTGPVLGESDKKQRGVKVPVDFWKVVVAIDADSGALLSSSYLLTQEGMMPTESFRYGPFKTYQVPIAKIEQLADLKFSKAVRNADVFSGADEEGPEGRGLEIQGPQDIVLTKKAKR